MPDIIKNGNLIKDDKGRLRIEFDNFIVGIKDNWKGEPTNKWIVTSYIKKENGESLYASSPITKGETLPLNSKTNSTPKEIKSQELNLSRAERRAMWIEELKGKTLVIDDKAVKSDVRGRVKFKHNV